MPRPYRLAVLGAGILITVLPALGFLLGGLNQELGYQVTSTLLLFSPYVGLALLSRRTRPKVAFGVLALVVLGTATIWLFAFSDAQGGIIALYILPLQWLLVALARFGRSGAPPDAADPPSRS